MSVEQSLALEASEIAIEGAAVRSGAKPNANVIRFKESVNLREDPQDFQFCHFMEPRRQKAKFANLFSSTHMLVYDN